MKTINSIKYILIALIVLGFFANFAQNEYGIEIAFYSLLGFLIIFLFESIYWRIKEPVTTPKTNRSRSARIIYPLSGIISLVCIVLAILSDIINLNIPGILFLILNLTWITGLIILFIYSSLYRPLFYESLALFFLCVSMIFKYLHFPGAGVLLIIACGFLSVHFFTQGTTIYKTLRKDSGLLALSVFAFFLVLAMSLTSFLFAMMHWPGKNMISGIILNLLILIAIPIVFRIKFKLKESKIVLWDRIKIIRGNHSLLFLFFTLSSIWWFLLMVNIAPGIYSNQYPPAMQNLAQENKTDKYLYYRYQMFSFFNNREKEEKSQEKKD